MNQMANHPLKALNQLGIAGKIILTRTADKNQPIGLTLTALQSAYAALSQSLALTTLEQASAALAADPALCDAVDIADFGDAAALSAIIAFAGSATGLKMLRLLVEPSRISELDRRLFDIGFVRVRANHNPWSGDGSTAYIRSDQIEDLDLLGEPTGGVIAMSLLGSFGRFANQLFQYAFLKLYGLRTNTAPQFYPWVGSLLYGADAPTPQPGLVQQGFPEFNGIERYLWSTSEPQINVDFAGFFQELPPTWRYHKSLFRRLLRPEPRFSDPIDAWLNARRDPDSTLIGIHIRRGDYGAFDHQKTPWFQFIPIAWYLDLLDQVWGSVERPSLLLASDEPNLSLRFRDYKPLQVPATELIGQEISYFGDFHALSRCDILTVVNSSYSRMAALIAADSQITYIPDIEAKRFVPYDPWEDESFWQRFESLPTTS
jgi:hypothetical protein